MRVQSSLKCLEKFYNWLLLSQWCYNNPCILIVVDAEFWFDPGTLFVDAKLGTVSISKNKLQLLHWQREWLSQ